MTGRTPDAAQMHSLIKQLPTKSAKIRALAAAGYARADIARFLEIRYQHVRNVLTQPIAKAAASPHRDIAREPVAASALEPETESVRLFRFHIDAEGRIKLPPELLPALDAAPGGLITAQYENGQLHLMNIAAAVRFAQKLASPYVKDGEGDWSAQLISERRAEASDERRDEQ